MRNVADYIPSFLDEANAQELARLIANTDSIIDDLFWDHQFRLISFLPPVSLWIHNFHLLQYLINFEWSLRRLQHIKRSTTNEVNDVVTIPVSSLQINQSAKVSTWITECIKWIIDANSWLKRIQETLT